ncbi:hypothetical protein [Kitasatospora sp. LaBMicrA B282]|uniref:hypothetical protein n=1 Tax=Kitasatospora sp. LaBMicrA B282 TaxID=3420949 RepID=UPI003D09E1E7
MEIEALCASVAEQRGRPLRLIPLPSAAGVRSSICGMWLAFPNADQVYYTPVTSPLHQTHIILHELAHMLLDHQQNSAAAPEALSRLFPDLDPAMAARLLARGRSEATDRQEQEAELLASLIWQRFTATPVAGETASPEAADTLARVMGSFTGREG